MLNKQIEKYLSTASGLPFFYSVSEEEYLDCLLKEVTKGEKHDEKAD